MCGETAVHEYGYLRARAEADAGSICIGDSGGPIVDEETGEVVGIASGSAIDESGVTCHAGSNAYYTPLFAHLAFIDEALAAGGAEPADADSGAEGCSATRRAPSSSVAVVLGLGLLAAARRRRWPHRPRGGPRPRSPRPTLDRLSQGNRATR
jgi:hypothetical protein